jgi:hypothetical protein
MASGLTANAVKGFLFPSVRKLTFTYRFSKMQGYREEEPFGLLI